MNEFALFFKIVGDQELVFTTSQQLKYNNVSSYVLWVLGTF